MAKGVSRSRAVPRTYAALRQQVEVTLVLGQQRVEAAKVRTYWETGRLIHEHLLLHQARAEYGTQVMRRLAGDLQVSETVLYRCLRFAERFPILADRPKLAWAHYRVLLPVADPRQRAALERTAIAQGWTCIELEDQIRPLRQLPSPPASNKGQIAGGATALLSPRRGSGGVFRVQAGGDELTVDLGFTSYVDLTPAQAGELRAGQLVRWTGTQPVAAPDATSAELYTYRAEVVRVVDGDTLWLKVYLRPRHWLKEKVRLRGVDCPELKTAAGQAAKRFVERLCAQAADVTVATTKPDKWDRYLADVFLTRADGPDVYLNNALLETGHATRYDTVRLEDWEEAEGG